MNFNNEYSYVSRLILIFSVGILASVLIFWLVYGKEQTATLLKRFFYITLLFLGLIGLIFLDSVEELKVPLDFLKSLLI